MALAAVAAVATVATAAERIAPTTCIPEIPDTCSKLVPPDPGVSFNSSSLRRFRTASVPPWRRAAGPDGEATSRMAELHELASRGLRPLLPRWRRDPAAQSDPGPFDFITVPRRFAATLYPVHVPDAEHWAAVLEAVQVGEACPCPLTQADGPGSVPDDADVPGVPFTIDKQDGTTELLLSWSSSCSTNVDDYAIFEGQLGTWYDHKDRLCTTNGQTSWSLQPGQGDRYYLIVPLNSASEGSYGTDSSGADRPPGTTTCRPVVLSHSCP